MQKPASAARSNDCGQARENSHHATKPAAPTATSDWVVLDADGKPVRENGDRIVFMPERRGVHQGGALRLNQDCGLGRRRTLSCASTSSRNSLNAATAFCNASSAPSARTFSRCFSSSRAYSNADMAPLAFRCSALTSYGDSFEASVKSFRSWMSGECEKGREVAAVVSYV
jgi:hypothetical protein